MKVLKITTAAGADFHVPLERGLVGSIEPHFPDAASVELLDMTEEQFQAIGATAEAYERFVA